MNIWHDIAKNLARLFYARSTSAKKNYLIINLGVWRIHLARRSLFKLPGIEYYQSITNTVPLLRRACVDLYMISPPMFVFMILAHFWCAVQDSLSLYFSSQLLFHVSCVTLT